MLYGILGPIMFLLCSCTAPMASERPPDLWPTLKEYTAAQEEAARRAFVQLCEMDAMSCVLIRDYMELRMVTRECRPAGFKDTAPD
jgi:hypothetical protein